MSSHGPSSGHPQDCYGCKLRTIQFGNVEPPAERLIDAQRGRDLPAYQRLRQQGFQPKHTKGCAELETRAHSQFEIDMHGLVEPGLWRKSAGVIGDVQAAVQEGMRAAREQNVGVDEIKSWRDQPAETVS